MNPPMLSVSVCQTRLVQRSAMLLVLATLLGITSGASAAATCASPQALGVAREVVLDTTAGQLYGNGEYTANADLLQDKEVVLTFDDGPLPETTRQILTALEAECTKATFFVVGRMALAYQTTLRDIDRRGHTIANHTWSHAFASRLSPLRAREEIERGVSMVSAVLGKPPAPFFRFPFLDDPIEMINYLKGRNFGIFSIDVDSYDTHGLTVTSEKIISKTINELKTKGKGIVLLHDIKRQTAEAVPELLRQLRENGFKIVHLRPRAVATTVAVTDAEAHVLLARVNADILASRGVPDGVIAAKSAMAAVRRIPDQGIVDSAVQLAVLQPGTGTGVSPRYANSAAGFAKKPALVRFALRGAPNTADDAVVATKKPLKDVVEESTGKATSATPVAAKPATANSESAKSEVAKSEPVKPESAEAAIVETEVAAAKAGAARIAAAELASTADARAARLARAEQAERDERTDNAARAERLARAERTQDAERRRARSEEQSQQARIADREKAAQADRIATQRAKQARIVAQAEADAERQADKEAERVRVRRAEAKKKESVRVAAIATASKPKVVRVAVKPKPVVTYLIPKRANAAELVAARMKR